MTRAENIFRTYMITCILVIFVVLFAGCGSVRHEIKFEPGFSPKPATRIEVGTMTNETGETFDIDICKMFADALSEALEKEGLHWTGGSGSEHLILTSKLVEYEKGDAFKRWLLPGWGSTVLSIHCELKDSASGRMVGSVDARRTVSFGGGYTIGAWRTIFAGVAKDVVKELRSKIST